MLVAGVLIAAKVKKHQQCQLKLPTTSVSTKDLSRFIRKQTISKQTFSKHRHFKADIAPSRALMVFSSISGFTSSSARARKAGGLHQQVKRERFCCSRRSCRTAERRFSQSLHSLEHTKSAQAMMLSAGICEALILYPAMTEKKISVYAGLPVSDT